MVVFEVRSHLDSKLTGIEGQITKVDTDLKVILKEEI